MSKRYWQGFGRRPSKKTNPSKPLSSSPVVYDLTTTTTPSIPLIIPKPTNNCIAKQDAFEAVLAIRAETECLFHLISFQTYNLGRSLRSSRYHSYDVLCHLNTHKCAGWLVCKYFTSGACEPHKALHLFNVAGVGTNSLERHTSSHMKGKHGTVQCTMPRRLGQNMKKEITKAACRAVAVDLLPFSFVDGHAGMEEFTKSVFQAGQFTSVSDVIRTSDLMPSDKAVRSTLCAMSKEERKVFKTTILNDAMLYGGGMTSDGVTMQMQDKHFFDLNLHFMSFQKRDRQTSLPKARIEGRTLLLVESESGKSADDIRNLLNNGLLRWYGIQLKDLTPMFTFVTDYCAVMPNVVGASVSANVAPLNEKWVGCIAHQINTVMKHCIENSATQTELAQICSDLKSVKTLVRIFKKSGWNHELGSGFSLIQEIETRFATTYYVAERFIRSGASVFRIVEQQDSRAAEAAMKSIYVQRSETGLLSGFPAIEAIIDACEQLVLCEKRLEASQTPTMHLVLPMLQKCKDELQRISGGGLVNRGFHRGSVPPSPFSRGLCNSMLSHLSSCITVHDMWLAAVLLHPFLREFQFLPELSVREQYRSRAEQFLQKLVDERSAKSTGNTNAESNPPDDDILEDALHAQRVSTARHNKEFSLADFADSHFTHTGQSECDEVRNYLRMDITSLGLDGKRFLDDNFGAVLF